MEIRTGSESIQLSESSSIDVRVSGIDFLQDSALVKFEIYTEGGSVIGPMLTLTVRLEIVRNELGNPSDYSSLIRESAAMLRQKFSTVVEHLGALG